MDRVVGIGLGWEGSVPSAFLSLRFGWVFSNSARAISFLSWKHSEAIIEQMDVQGTVISHL